MKRAEYLKQCKARALSLVEKGDLNQALTSILNGLSKHPKTASHLVIRLGTMLLASGKLKTALEMRKFINSFD